MLTWFCLNSPPFAMLQPVAAPASSASDGVAAKNGTLPVAAVLVSKTRKYVVLAARSTPSPDAVNWLTPLASAVGFVNVASLASGCPADVADQISAV